MMPGNALSANVWHDLLVGLPGLIGGVVAGLFLFRRIHDRTFRRVVLSVLFVSGVSRPSSSDESAIARRGQSRHHSVLRYSTSASRSSGASPRPMTPFGRWRGSFSLPSNE